MTVHAGMVPTMSMSRPPVSSRGSRVWALCDLAKGHSVSQSHTPQQEGSSGRKVASHPAVAPQHPRGSVVGWTNGSGARPTPGMAGLGAFDICLGWAWRSAWSGDDRAVP